MKQSRKTEPQVAALVMAIESNITSEKFDGKQLAGLAGVVLTVGAVLVGSAHAKTINDPTVYLPLNGSLVNLGSDTSATAHLSLDSASANGVPSYVTSESAGHGQALSLASSAGASTASGYNVSIDYTLTNSGTISLWFYATGPWYNYQSLWGNSASQEDWESWVYNDGRLGARAAYGSTNAIYDLDNLAGPNHWYQIAWAWQRSTSNPAQVNAVLYVDGVQRSSVVQNWVSPGTTFYLGGSFGGNNFNTYSVYDELRIYDYALSSSEVAQLPMLGIPEPMSISLGLLSLGVIGLRRRPRE